MDIRPTLLACATVILVVVATLFVWLPPPFTGSELVLFADLVVLIAGGLAMIVIPAIMMRSAGAVAVAAVAVPMYLFSVYAAAFYVPFAWATVRCLREPVMVTGFAAADSYSVPGDRDYGPGPLAEYVCTSQEAEAAGYRRTPLP